MPYQPRDLNRMPIVLNLIAQVWQLPGHSDMRLGQLLIAVTSMHGADFSYGLEDDQLEFCLRAYLCINS